MNNTIFEDKDFSYFMSEQTQNMLKFLINNNYKFAISCKIDEVAFSSPLPSDAIKKLQPITLFYLAGYTFQSATIQNGSLKFEAGFGVDNVGVIVDVPLLAITQIIVNDKPVFINCAKYYVKNTPTKPNLENSMNAFLSNPQNRQLWGKMRNKS